MEAGAVASTSKSGGEAPEVPRRPSTQSYRLVAKWNGKEFSIVMDGHRTIAQLKAFLSESTDVPPDRQKLIGLVKGKPAPDDATLASLGLSTTGPVKFMMMGTPDKHVKRDIHDLDPSDLPDVINDLDQDYLPDRDDARVNKENRAKLQKRIENIDVRIIHEARPGKKLLVLDLDYTLFDMKSPAEHMHELRRPGLMEFMTLAYQHYDIVVWSQTSWKWLEMKLTDLGLLTSEHFKIHFVLDRTSMFSINTVDARGDPWSHEVKALEFIWAKFPERNASNTIHIDDLGRNFAMNPQCGLKISAYKTAATSKHTDRELYYLIAYLIHIAEKEPDFTKLKHKEWKRLLAKLGPEVYPIPVPPKTNPGLGGAR